jgi:hypothetical protein
MPFVPHSDAVAPAPHILALCALMNKKRPNEIRSYFGSEGDSLIAFFNAAAAGFSGTPHQDKNLTMLAELVFLNSYVAFEAFLSDLFLAYINKKSISYQHTQEAKIKKLIKEEFGDWYSNRISMSKAQHLTVEEVQSLIDPNGFNITFGSSTEIKRLAGGWIAQEFRNRIFTLTDNDFLFIDCAREMRNTIAHKSKRSLTAMNTLLRSIPNGSTIDFIRRPANDVRTVGVFLKARSNGNLRVLHCIERLKDIASRM